MRLRWSAASLEDLRRVRSAALLTRIRRRVGLLIRFPASGRVMPEFGREDLREVVAGVFRISYLVRENEIVVQSVWDARRPAEKSSDRIRERTVAYSPRTPP